MDNQLVLTERELQEIGMAMTYSQDFNHGTDGHNRLNLVTKLALAAGFRPSPHSKWYVEKPENCRIDNFDGKNITWPL